MYSGVFSSLFIINNYFSQFNGTNGTFLNVHRISRYPRLVYAPYTTVRPPPISNDLWSMMYASQFLDAIETRMNQSQRCRWDVQNSHQSTVCISSFDSNFFDPGFDFRFYNYSFIFVTGSFANLKSSFRGPFSFRGPLDHTTLGIRARAHLLSQSSQFSQPWIFDPRYPDLSWPKHLLMRNAAFSEQFGV